MNKLGRCPQGDAKNQISKLYTFQFQRKRILKMGFFIPMFQLLTPRLGPILTLGASYKKKIGKGPPEDATYQISKL